MKAGGSGLRGSEKKSSWKGLLEVIRSLFKAGLTSKTHYGAQSKTKIILEMKSCKDNSITLGRGEQSETSTLQHLGSKKRKLASLWFNAFSTKQEAPVNLQCKYQPGKQRPWGIKSYESSLASLRSSLRNISTSQPSRCLVLTHLLWYNIRLAAAPLTSSFGWRPHTELTHSPPCLSRRRKLSMLKGTTYISWILQLHRHCTFSILAFIFMVTYSK